MSCGSRRATKASTSSSRSPPWRRTRQRVELLLAVGLAGGRALLGDLVADPLQGAPEDAGDVHLRVADPLGDLRLRQVLDEAQLQNEALALVEVGESSLQRQFVLDQFVAGVFVAHPLGRRRFFGVLAADRSVERERPAV